MPGEIRLEECKYKCKKFYNRRCEISLEDNGFNCMGCLHNHIERDGECLKLEQVERDSEKIFDFDSGQSIDNLVNEQRQAENANNVPEITGVDEEEDDHPKNYKVHKVHHSPHHSQEQKVHKVQTIADANQAREEQELPQPAYLKHPDPGDRDRTAADAASMADVYFLAVVAGCSVAGLVGLVVAGVCWYRLQKNVKAASDVDYPAYGVTGPNKEGASSPSSTGGDRKLAQSAQMYHYQHQRQQMIALEKANNDMNKDGSDVDSEEENEEGDYTVFECPGLAPTGEMEVKNPLFSEETPVTPDTHNQHK